MIDFYLKFADEAEANKVIADLTDYSIDVVGTIYKNGTPLTGWHVNLRGADTTQFYAYHVAPDPSTPYRTWA